MVNRIKVLQKQRNAIFFIRGKRKLGIITGQEARIYTWFFECVEG